MNILFSNKSVKALWTGLATMVMSICSTNLSALESSAKAASLSAPIAATILKTDATHEGKTKSYLFCKDAGSNIQTCRMYMQTLAGIGGVVNETLLSKVAISAVSVAATNNSGLRRAGSLTFGTITDTAPGTGEFNHGQGAVDQSPSFELLEGGADTGRQNIAAETGKTYEIATADVGAITGNTCVAFDGADIPYGSYVPEGTTYTPTPGSGPTTISGIVGDVSVANKHALILLGGWSQASFPRTDLVYADKFNVSYTLTVTTNTSEDGGDSQSCD